MQQFTAPRSSPGKLLLSLLSLLIFISLFGAAQSADAAPPPAPVITSPAGAPHYTKNTSVTLSGSAAAGSTVTVFRVVGESATELATGLPVSGGTWSYAATLDVGVNYLGARASNGDGPGESSVIKVIVVDQTAPVKPVIVSPLGTPASPAYVNQTTPLVQGVAEPLTTVRVLDGSTVVATTTAAVNGEWSVNTSTLASGTRSLRARSTDLAGNDSPYSDTQTVVVDTVSPDAPTITTPAGSTAFIPNSNATVSGSAEADSTITIYNNGELLVGGLATSGTSWSWSGTLGGSSENLIVAWAVDRAGNVSAASTPKGIIVDAIPPTVSISSPTNGSRTSNPAPTVVFNYVEQYPAAVECSVDSGQWNACGSGNQLASLNEGLHTFGVRVRDLAGNQASASTQFTVDYTAPAAPTITSGPNAPVATDSASFGFSGEAGGSFECALDTIEVWQSCTSPRAFSSLAQGGHNFYVRQIDAAGNVGEASVRTWVVDTTGPAAPSILGPSGTVAETAASVAFTTTETPVTYTCKHNAAAAAPCSSPTQLSGLSSGAHSFTVTAYDPLGNASAPSTINWTIDTALFSVAIFGGPVGVVPNATSAFEFGATLSDGTSYFCSVDSAVSFSPCGSPFSTGALAEGSHTFRVYATNGSLTSETVAASWTIDTTGPEIAITAPAPGATTGPNGQLSFSTSDATGGVSTTCQIDSDAPTPCSSPAPYYGLEGGSHSATITATDAVGNSSVLVRNFNVDSAAPQTTITAGPPTRTNSTSATITFASDKPGSTFECMLGEDDVTPCNGSVTFNSLADGTYVFQVRATDPLGNPDPTPAARVWTVDTVAPDPPSIGSPPVDITVATTSLQLSGTAEPGSTVLVKDGSTTLGTAITGPDGLWALSPNPTLAEGAHNVTATATDTADNESAPSVVREITIDTVAPVVTISSPQNGAKLATNTASIQFNVAEANPSATLCSLNGSAYTPCSSPYNTGVLSESEQHTFGLLAVDAAGNQAATSITFTVDVTAPQPPSIAAPADGSFVKDADLQVLGYAEPGSTVVVEDAGIEICSATADGGGLFTCTPAAPFAEGAHSLRAHATDAVGNESAQSGPSAFTLDTLLPSVEISTPTANQAFTGPSKRVTVEFDLDGTGTAASAQCSANAINWEACSSPWETGALTDGFHTLRVRATDQAGNSADAAVLITLDTGPPVVTIDSAPAAVTSERSATFGFSADDPAASFECRVDAAAFAPCTSPATLPGPLADGFHTFGVRATDVHGASSAEVTRNWTVSTPPQPPSGGGNLPGSFDPLPKACFSSGVLITDVLSSGRSIKVSGFASTRHAGKSVRVVFRLNAKKVLGSAPVQADGRFSLKVAAPTKAQRRAKKAAYRASIGNERSPWAPLAARIGKILASYSEGRMRVSGTLVRPLAPRAKVLVRVREGCGGRFEQNADTSPSSSGRFTMTFPFATPQNVVFVQLESSVRKSSRSHSTQKIRSPIIPVRIR